jgi:zinc transporter ZupT
MNRSKLIITAVLIAGLMLLIVLIAFGLVMFFINDVLYWSDGILSLLAFVVAAFIIGIAMSKVINRVKRLWE